MGKEGGMDQNSALDGGERSQWVAMVGAVAKGRATSKTKGCMASLGQSQSVCSKNDNESAHRGP